MAESDSQDEQQLIARARGNDLDAFNLLVDRYQGLVYRVSMRVLSDSGRAEDAVGVLRTGFAVITVLLIWPGVRELMAGRRSSA